MLTESFLLQSARDYGLTSKQESVFILKIFKNLSYDEIASQLGISKAACLKRMGEVYDKFDIGGMGRGKEQRLKKTLRLKSPQSGGLAATASQSAIGRTSANTTPVSMVGTSVAKPLSNHDVWIKSLEDWFSCLGYRIESQIKLTNEVVEWVVRVRARRGWDCIVIHGVQGEAQSSHIRDLRGAVCQHTTEEGWIVAPRRVSSMARQEVALPNNDDLFCYTFDELIDQEVSFEKYFEWLEKSVEDNRLTDRYIQLACRKAEFIPYTQEPVGYSYYTEGDGWIDGYIDRWIDDPVKEHISILGEFGTGKTWFTLHYAWQSLQAYKQAKQRGLERPRLPLIIPLRDCAKAATLESLVSEYFLRKYEIALPDYKVFEQLNRMGKLLLIFDGFDEMASKVDRQSMVNNFWQLARVVVPGSKVILTCRTEHFPDAKEGRKLLNAELKASTDGLSAESPQFEVLELEKLSDEQIQQVVDSRVSPETAARFMNHPELSSLARRPLMLDLILEALPEINIGQPVDLARIYLYAVSQKMEEDITAERTFTSLADKLYFLCELSWEMLSTDQMSLSYKAFPDRIRQFFGSAVQSNTDLDHWHYDMMGQTMLIRNEHGEYSPVHRSLLEFFAAYKLAAELGCLSPDFVWLAQKQSYIDAQQTAQRYSWSGYFQRKTNRKKQVVEIAPLQTFSQESRQQLRQAAGHSKLSKAILELMMPMMDVNDSKAGVVQQLLSLLESAETDQTIGAGDYLSGNLITLLLKIDPLVLQEKDLSNRIIRGADFTHASLRNLVLAGTHLEDCTFPQDWSGDLSVAFSPDGQFLAIVDSTGEISLRDVNRDEQLWQKKGHSDWIRSIAFDIKSKTLATGSHDQFIRLWDVETGQLIREIKAGSRVYSLAFSQKYDVLASSGDQNSIKLWDARTGQCQRTLEGHTSWVGVIAFGRNQTGEVLASGSDNGTLMLWNIQSGQCLHQMETGKRSVHAIAFDAESKKLVSGGADNTLKVWNADTGKCIRTMEGHRDWVRSVSLSAGGAHLASGSNDQTIRLWNAETGECIRTIDAHTTRVWSVAFHPNQQMLVSGSDDRTTKLWDVQTGQCIKTLWGSSRGLWSVAFSDDTKMLYCGSDDHTVQSWDISSQKNMPAFRGHTGRVRTISLSRAHNVLASGSDDKTVKLWDRHTGECLRTLENHSDWVWSVDFSADGQTLASGSLDNKVMLWDMQTQRHIKTLEGHTQFVWSVKWSPTALLLASGSADKKIRLWDGCTGECLRVLSEHRHHVASVSFSPDGEVLASASDDGEIKLWSVATGACFLTIDDESQIRTIALSPDGRYLASGGLDKVVRLRDVRTGEYIREITTHTEPVLSLAFSLDGQYLISGGEAGVLRLSEVYKEGCVRSFSVDSLFKGLDLTSATGLSPQQRSNLLSLGAVAKA